jgi:hypothetical protein
MVDLCRAVADGLAKQIGMADLKVTYVPVTSTDRFDAITGGKADLLCEATTVTLRRRESLGFSIATFVDGASFIIRSTGPKDIAAMGGQKVAVLAGTTTEQDLRRAFGAAKVDADIRLMQTHQEGLDAVEKGTVVAYFADRAILTSCCRAAAGVEQPGACRHLPVGRTLCPRHATRGRRLQAGGGCAVEPDLSFGRDREALRGDLRPGRPSPTLLGLYMTSALPQ